MNEHELTKEEERAIQELTKLAKKWPKTLWLFANGQALYVNKVGEDGKPAMNRTGTYDPDYTVASINIPCDGGDW